MWEQVLAGNRRFVEDRAQRPHTDPTRRMSLRAGQNPRVVVLACSDSRVPVELVYDLGLGDAFVVRTAGHIVDHSVLASVQYAIENVGCNLLVVMGHQSCGAVAATAEFMESAEIPAGFQRSIIEKVSLSVLASQHAGHADTDEYERQHTLETVNQLLARLPLAEPIAAGTLGVVGTRYLLDDGSIEPVVMHGVH